MEILKHIIPLICLLTIHSDETTFTGMFDLMNQDKYVYDILDITKNNCFISFNFMCPLYFYISKNKFNNTKNKGFS